MLRRSDMENYGRVVEAQAQAWAAKRAGHAPEKWQGRILSEWRERRQENEREGNTWLRELADGMRQCGGLGLDSTDADIRAAARDIAANLYETAAALPVKTLAGIRAGLEDVTRRHGIEPPSADCTDKGACARMLQSDWWVRRLRAAHGRRLEFHAVGLGYVHRRAQCYASDANVRRRQEQRERNARALEAVTLVNQYDDEYTLAALAEKSNANPIIRRNELMTRIAGFEAVAKVAGHAAEFWTLTCPSRFHAVLWNGKRNPKFGGATAREAQAHLVKAWARFRAAAGRRGIRLYGFRIAEPHHDGCPHWHLLVWCDEQLAIAARGLALRYFLDQHEPDEKGAAENRCKFVMIDPARGSAAGYVAKYVAKNIDGYKLGADLFGNDEITTAARVDAWASTWGIRQFQQIGGAPVGVWRELRRIPKEDRMGPTADAARDAADAGDWAAYVGVMGGPMVERKALPLKVAYTPEGERFCPVENLPVEGVENCYGEPAAPAVFGIEDAWGARFLSRRFKWEKRWGVKSVRSVRESERMAVEGRRAVVAGSAGAEVGSGEGEARSAAPSSSGLSKGEARAAWTRVNNCTQGGVSGSAEDGCNGGGASRGEGRGGDFGRADARQGDGRAGIVGIVGGAAGYHGGAIGNRASNRGGAGWQMRR